MKVDPWLSIPHSLRSTSMISVLGGDADTLNTEVGAESEAAMTYDADMGSPSVNATFIRPTRPRLIFLLQDGDTVGLHSTSTEH